MGLAFPTTSPLVKTYTLEEFWELPEPKNRFKLELIAGVLYMAPPPGYKHDDVVSILINVLRDHLRDIDNDGRIYVPRAAIWTSHNTYVEPDLFYVSTELEAEFSENHLRNKADLVVEVLSPGSEIYDRTTKADTYGALGIRELWLIDENKKTVEIRKQIGSGFDEGQIFKLGEVIESVIFPKLILPVWKLFA